MDILSILEDKLKIQEDKWIERRLTDEMNQIYLKIRRKIQVNSEF